MQSITILRFYPHPRYLSLKARDLHPFALREKGQGDEGINLES
jgi:hypothetical protein